MTATVILFRRPQPANTFGQRDVAELHRWAALAARVGLFLQTDHDPQTGEERWIGRADAGSEYVSVAAGSSAGRHGVHRDTGERPVGPPELSP